MACEGVHSRKHGETTGVSCVMGMLLRVDLTTWKGSAAAISGPTWAFSDDVSIFFVSVLHTMFPFGHTVGWATSEEAGGV